MPTLKNYRSLSRVLKYPTNHLYDRAPNNVMQELMKSNICTKSHLGMYNAIDNFFQNSLLSFRRQFYQKHTM